MTLSVRVVYVLFIVAAAFLLAIPGSARADCPAGTTPLTSATLATALISNPTATIGMCWSASDANVGATPGDAKQWLQQHANKGANISCLNPQFAEKLQKFMQADPLGVPIITDAYRTQAQQQAIINRGDGSTRVSTPCGSYHPWGLAADFNQNNAQQTDWMRANASTYGIGILGTWDPNHMQDAMGKYGECGACNPSSTGNGTLTPQPTVGAAGAPFSGAINQALAPPPPPPPPPPQSAAAPAPLPSTLPTTASCTPQYSCNGGTYYYENSSCNIQPMQACQYGCTPDGTACASSAPSSSTSSSTPTVTLTTVPIATNTATDTSDDTGDGSGIDANDFIDQYAGFTAVDIATATPIDVSALDQNLGGQAMLQASNSPEAAGQDATGQILGTPAQQTFTSNDLADSPTASEQTSSWVSGILSDMQAVLTNMLYYLQPFGGTPPSQMQLE